MADNIKFSQDYEIIPPQKQRSYPISTTEWGLIKKKILDVKGNANFWHTLGSILIGTAIPALITALIGDFKTEKSSWICWGAFLITGISGTFAFYFGKEQRETQNKSKEDVIDFMKTIEDRFQNSPQNTPTNADIEIISATYLWPGNQKGITNEIKSLVSKGITTGKVDPGVLGIDDPKYGTVKTLKIHYRINGEEKDLTAKDGDTFIIE